MSDSDRVLGVFLIYSIAMFTVPLITFFGVQCLLKDYFHVEGFNNMVWSVICAVAVVNFIIVLYARRAYYDEIHEQQNGSNSDTQETRVINKKMIKPRYVRVNTLQHTPDEVIKMFRDEGWIFLQSCSDYDSFLEMVQKLKDDEFTKDFHIKELLVFPPGAQFYKNELYLSGGIVLQDKASCLPVCLLQPPPNSIVLDMCAAPGMKTTHLSARMKDKGIVYAVESNSRRYETLCGLVKNIGCSNVKPINMDALLIGRNDDTSWCRDVEYILVDPSCSGTGMVDRKNVFPNEQKDNQRIKKLCAFQFKLLMHALTNFPNAKRVVYSTCSVLTVENEKVVDDVLRKLSQNDCPLEFELVDAMESWSRRGAEEYEFGRRCLFADPKKDKTNGFFVAVFERRERRNGYEEAENKKTQRNLR